MKAHLTPFKSALLTLAALCCVVGCDAPKSSIELSATAKARPATLTKVEPAAVVKDATKPSHHYSPFVLDVKSKRSLFRKISFKDVGVHVTRDELRESLYETMAESLASELTVDTALSMPASVVYDEAIMDPLNHLACGSDHLYVDVWKSDAPSRWGYSLWSGCGEDDNFAWKEVSFSPHPAGDVTEEIKPLAQSIVASIREANKRGCYQKTC